MEIVLENAQLWTPGRRVKACHYFACLKPTVHAIYTSIKKSSFKNEHHSTHLKLRIKWLQQKTSQNCI